MSNMVFISYAKEDVVYAEELFDFLAKNGYEPWMDKKKILPGEEWDFQIKTALRKSDFIILLLSNISVTKLGYVQREFKLALQYYEERPQNYIYIIPLKIDDCKVPTELSKFQWEMYNNSEAFDNVLQSLKKQNGEPEKDKIKGLTLYASIDYEEVQIKNVIGENPKIFVDIKYIQFNNSNIKSLNELNTIIKHAVSHKLNYDKYSLLPMKEYREKLRSNNENIIKSNIGHNGNWSSDISYSIRLLKPTIISMTLFRSSYSGGAHGGYATIGYNFILEPLISISIDGLFGDLKNALEFIRKTIYSKLLGQLKKTHEGYNKDDDGLYSRLLEGEWKLFKNFYLTESSVVFIFNPYELMLGFADQLAEITFDELSVGLPNDNKMQANIDFIRSK